MRRFQKLNGRHVTVSRFGSGVVINLKLLHVTAIPIERMRPFGCKGYVTPVAAGQLAKASGFFLKWVVVLVWEYLINWYWSILVRLLGSRILLLPGVGLESGGLMFHRTGYNTAPYNTVRAGKALHGHGRCSSRVKIFTPKLITRLRIHPHRQRACCALRSTRNDTHRNIGSRYTYTCYMTTAPERTRLPVH
jgi:hypothetical protein